MKLHLPLLVRRCLLTCLSIAAPCIVLTLPSAQAEEIFLPTGNSDSVTWVDGNAPGYTGSSGDYYRLTSSATWNIISGSYTILSSDETAIRLSAGSLNNSATVDIVGELQGIRGRADTPVTNQGTVNITLESSGSLSVQAISATPFINERSGSLTIRSKWTNPDTSAGASARGYACAFYNGSLDNYGNVDVTVEGINRNARGLSSSTSIANEAGATMTLRANSTGNGIAYGISLGGGGTMLNEGTIEVHAQADTTAYGINLLDTASIENTQGASLRTTGTTAGIYMVSGNFFNGGELQTNSILLEGGNFHMLHGSTITHCISDYSSSSLLGVSVTGGTVSLGGAGKEMAAVEGGSLITVGSHLSLSGTTLSLADDVTLAMGGDLTVAEDVTHTWNGHTLTVDNGGTMRTVSMGSLSLSLDKSVAFTEAEGKVSVAQSGGGTTTVNGGSMQTMGSLSVGSSEATTELKSDTEALALSADQGGTVINSSMEAVNITVSGSFDMSFTLDGVTMNVLGGSLTLNNVEVRGQSSFQMSDEMGSLVTAILNNVTFVFEKGEMGNSQVVPPLATFSLPDALESAEAAASDTFFVYSDMLENLYVNGSLTLDLADYASDVKSGGYGSVGVMFSENTVFAENTTVTATLDGVNLAQAYKVEDGTMYFSVKEMSNVPEPATATLSLLALTALAARRRRR